MSKKDNFTIRIEPELRTLASDFFGEFGLDLSTATRMFYIDVLRNRRIPFNLSLEPNVETYAAIEAAEKGEVVGPFDNVDSLMEALNA